MRTRKPPVASEHEEQKTLFKWMEMMSGRYPGLQLAFAIPNGGLRNVITARRMKAEGVKAGVPDIFIPIPVGERHGLFIEMKRKRGGRQTPEQAKWSQELAIHGYMVCLCFGWENASAAVVDYLEGRL